MPFIAKNAVLPSQADITSEQRILEPEKDGLEGIPAVSFAQYSTNWKALPEHVHKGCIELCFCARGSLVFECEGEKHTILPNNVFVTQPGDRHHLVTNHKGMRIYWPPKIDLWFLRAVLLPGEEIRCRENQEFFWVDPHDPVNLEKLWKRYPLLPNDHKFWHFLFG